MADYAQLLMSPCLAAIHATILCGIPKTSGNTLERIRIPDDVVGLVEGRSSWARVGISIHVTAPKIDPGFDATITLEMYNFGKIAVDLRAGIDQPAQLMLVRVTTPLKEQELYGHGDHDRFQHQTSPIPHKEKASAAPGEGRGDTPTSTSGGKEKEHLGRDSRS